MTQFHEGQEVEVYSLGTAIQSVDAKNWRKAKIVRHYRTGYMIEFPDGRRAEFDAEHIRAPSPEELSAREADFGIYD